VTAALHQSQPNSQLSAGPQQQNPVKQYSVKSLAAQSHIPKDAEFFLVTEEMAGNKSLFTKWRGFTINREIFDYIARDNPITLAQQKIIKDHNPDLGFQWSFDSHRRLKLGDPNAVTAPASKTKAVGEDTDDAPID
jgi:hypothetical protein